MNANDISPTLQLKLDVTLYIEWYRNQIVGNRAVHLKRAI